MATGPESPVWRTRAFVDVFLPHYRLQYDPHPPVVEGIPGLLPSIALVVEALRRVQATSAWPAAPAHAREGLVQMLSVLQFAEHLGHRLPDSMADIPAVVQYLELLVRDGLHCTLPAHGLLLVPGGWNVDDRRHAAFFAVHPAAGAAPDADTLSFVIINTGSGSQYHANTLHADTQGITLRHALSLVVPDVPKCRVLNSSLWWLLARTARSPASNGTHHIYGTVIPYLSGRCLEATVRREQLEWRDGLHAGDVSYVRATLEALHYGLQRVGLTQREAECAAVLVQWGLCLLAQSQLEKAQACGVAWRGVAWCSVSYFALCCGALRCACACACAILYTRTATHPLGDTQADWPRPSYF